MATISEAFDAALELHAAGRLYEAGVLYGRILDVAPDHSQALYLAGTLMCQQGRYDDARPLLERAVARAPDLAAAHLNLARLHARAEDWGAAARGNRRCLALDPGEAPAWELLGMAERQMGRPDEAVAAFERAHRIAPQDAGIGEKLGLLLCERGQRRLEGQRNAAAVADLARAAQLLPFDIVLGFALGTGLSELGRNAEAAGVYERVLAWSPIEPRVLHNLGVALTRIGRVDDAARTLRRAVTADPDCSDPHEALAALFDRRDPAQAIVWSTRALELKLKRSGAPPSEPMPATKGGVQEKQRTRDVVSFSLWGGAGGLLRRGRRERAAHPRDAARLDLPLLPRRHGAPAHSRRTRLPRGRAGGDAAGKRRASGHVLALPAGRRSDRPPLSVPRLRFQADRA